ncbi:AAA family ATPase [uncultured Treponema sp.]|uniref:AAA family ATPase n=1 Tax=uncultured Treponema sp. TaxID=162155 RepID=UPI00280B16B5|nr:AAA family ATPase [uncultured Treponema sp.]
MFNNLLSKNIKPDISKIESIQETKISGDLKLELTKLFNEEEKGFVNVSDCTTIIKTDKNYVFFPNQYYYLAVICKDYAEALCEYCDFFDKKIRNSNELNFIVLNQDFKNIKYTELFENEDDLKKFTRFLIDENYRPGKKFINGKEDKSFRGTKDIFGSCILKMLPLPDASSGYFGNIVYYLSKRKNLFQKLEKFYAELNVISSVVDLNCNLKPAQTIYYGVPGCGKSNKIDEETINTSDEQKMRVVFHPEYTNADFVGQILPTNVDGNVEYKFRPGPLSKILRRAYLHPDKKYYLIVEEINRGNAAAIFGEYFQLLDRIAAKKEVPANGYTYTEGWSRYSIENEFINWYIRENLYADVNHKLQNEDDGIAKKSDDESQKAIEIGNLHFSANTGIRLPPNLSILATMNTSDQNVFILDNAFQRRWDMVLVKNEFGKAKTEEEQKNVDQQKTAKIGDSQITWETFQKTINEKISQFSKENNFSSMIDKRLGCWFVKAVPDKTDANGKYIITEDSFKNKILKYLWDDAFKFCHEDVFEDADNFEALLEKVKMDKPDFGVFKNVDFSEKEEEN